VPSGVELAQLNTGQPGLTARRRTTKYSEQKHNVTLCYVTTEVKAISAQPSLAWFALAWLGFGFQ